MNKQLLNYGDKVCIIACSDGLKEEYSENLSLIIDILEEMKLEVVLAKSLYRKVGPFSGTPKERANELMKAFCDKSIKAIFDISGGDSANEVLELLDYEKIKTNEKPFLGISDLTVILNSLYSCGGVQTYHYMIRNLVGEDSVNQIKKFKRSFIEGKDDIYRFDYNWIKGSSMKGKVIGGNIRAFLKLAGTKYLPDPTDKILFLESFGGGPNRMASLLTQLKYIGYLDKINGIILVTFSQMEGQELKPDIEKIIDRTIGEKKCPVIKTASLGHGDDAGCIVIGGEIDLS